MLDNSMLSLQHYICRSPFANLHFAGAVLGTYCSFTQQTNRVLLYTNLHCLFHISCHASNVTRFHCFTHGQSFGKWKEPIRMATLTIWNQDKPIFWLLKTVAEHHFFSLSCMLWYLFYILMSRVIQLSNCEPLFSQVEVQAMLPPSHTSLLSPKTYPRGVWRHDSPRLREDERGYGVTLRTLCSLGAVVRRVFRHLVYLGIVLH